MPGSAAARVWLTMAVAGTAKRAVPITAALCARPDMPTPAMSAASSAPTDAPTATPMPLMIWVTKSSRSVRRWTAAISMGPTVACRAARLQ